MSVTRFQIPHTMGDLGLTSNVLAQSTAKVAMESRFVGLVGSLPPDEQQIWLPNQLVHDPQTWVAPHLIQLQSEYVVLLNKHNCKKSQPGDSRPMSPSQHTLSK
jgi:hypothetical protein